MRSSMRCSVPFIRVWITRVSEAGCLGNRPLWRRAVAGTGLVALATCVSAQTAACDGRRGSASIDLATTTSFKHSGVLAAVLPSFSDATIHVHATRSGEALEMVADEVVDIAITHAPEIERRFLASHSDVLYRKFAYNQFVILGPPEDPADVRHAVDAVEAFRRIAVSPMTFVSHDDNSGAHEREQWLWNTSGIRPESSRMVISGSGMARAIVEANERQGYVLSDEATFRQLVSQIDLVIVRSNDPALLNTYAAVYRRDHERAQRFVDWLSHGVGRVGIKKYRIADAAVFTVWPEACPDDKPSAQPCA